MLLRGSSEDMQVDQRVFLAANSSVKLCCACACTRDPHSQSVSGNVHPEPVNIWVCLQSASHQTCSCARIAWMLFVSITSADPSFVVRWSAVACTVFLSQTLLMISGYPDFIGAMKAPHSVALLETHVCILHSISTPVFSSRYFRCCWQLTILH